MSKTGFAIRGGATALVLVAGFAAAFYPVWEGLVQDWIKSDDNSHGLLIVPISLFILWLKRERLAEIRLSPSWWGLVPVVLSLLLYLLAETAEIRTLSSLSMVFFLFGVAVYYGGLPLLRELAFPLTLLFLMIPVPSQIYASLTVPLQLIVTRTSVWVASSLSIPIYHEGNIIHLPERTVQVVQACSGLRSIMTLLTLGAVIGYLKMRSGMLRTILFVTGIPVAVIVNIVRVVLLVSFLHFFGIDFTSEGFHTAFGTGVFLLSLFLMFAVTRGLVWWENRIA